MTTSAEPGLYEIDAGGTPQLAGIRCRRCGQVAYPAQAFGCERCGAVGDDLEPSAFTGRGTVLASAVVHLHRGRDIAAPFTVAAIQLAEGPTVRGVMDTNGHVAQGTRVAAVGLRRPDVEDPAVEVTELRFRTEED